MLTEYYNYVVIANPWDSIGGIFMMSVRVVRLILRAAVLLGLAALMSGGVLASDGPMPPPPTQSSLSK